MEYDIEDKRLDEDSFLGSLVFVARYYQRTVSIDSLVAGIVEQGKLMDLNTFSKAAKRIGFITKVVNREIQEISHLALPALLVLKDGKAAVLLDISVEDNYAKLVIPGIPGETEMTLDHLKNDYSGTMSLIKNTYRFKNKLHKDIQIDNPKKWFWGTMKRNIHLYKKVIIAAIMINLFVLATPMFTMNVYDRVLPNNAIETLTVLAIGIFLVMVFDVTLKSIRSHYLGIANKRADIVMSNKIFDHLLNIRLEEKPPATGMFVNRLQSFASVRDFFSTATIALVVDLPFIILFITMIFWLGGPMGWISIATVIIILVFSWFMQRPLKEIVEKSSKEDQIKSTTLTETVAGLEIIKTVRGQNRVKVQYENALSQTAYFDEKSQHLAQNVSYITAFLAQFSNIAIVTTGVILAADGNVTQGAIIASMMLNGRVIGPVSQIVSLVIRFDRTMIAFKNIDELMSMEIERDDKNYLSRPDLSGDIIFKDVRFSYKNQNFEVLKGINFSIKEGEKVGLIGKIGSGKSTISKLLMNLYVPTSGSIMLDDTDVRQIDPIDLRGSIGHVPQEPFLFLGTIKDNITIGENFVSDEDVIRAAKIAGVTDFLGKYENGFDTMVGERGSGFSGGERQAITLARAIISDPKILILDEPTNSMDSQTERAFIRNMRDVVKDKTLLVLTHKMSILSLVDRIIVLHDGQIIKDGPRDEILAALKGGK